MKKTRMWNAYCIAVIVHVASIQVRGVGLVNSKVAGGESAAVGSIID